MDSTKKMAMLLGSGIGALLGAGAAYLILTSPKAEQFGEEPEPLEAKDLLTMTGAAALFIRKIDDIRRRV